MDFSATADIYQRYKAASLDETIHPNDVMHNTGRPWYFTVGDSAMRAILSALTLSWRQNVETILDLPCGHGRVTRHLRAAFPDATIAACDLDHEGVDFCAEQFGCVPIHSEPDLTKVALPANNDIIWIGSLFTHVDIHRTAAWLEYLCRHLREHGVLVATFHGYFTRDFTERPSGGVDWPAMVRDFDAVGHGYDTYKAMDMGDYGTSLTKPSTIMDIAAAIPGVRVLAYTERGWANNQDVLVVTKNDRRKKIS